jgi:hypothetical protein
LENELLRIDRAWEQERKKYMSWDGRVVPSRARSVAWIVVGTVVIVGFVSIIIASYPATSVIVLVAVPIACLGLLVLIGTSLYTFLKADVYEKAEAEYQQWREAAKTRYETMHGFDETG